VQLCLRYLHTAFMLTSFYMQVHGGGNLTCTVIYLTLLALSEKKDLGKDLHVQLDNTTSENKNWIVMCFVGWLVQMGYFRTARVFFLLKGDTKTELDQTFGVYMTSLKAQCILKVCYLYVCVTILHYPTTPAPPHHLYHTIPHYPTRYLLHVGPTCTYCILYIISYMIN